MTALHTQKIKYLAIDTERGLAALVNKPQHPLSFDQKNSEKCDKILSNLFVGAQPAFIVFSVSSIFGINTPKLIERMPNKYIYQVTL